MAGSIRKIGKKYRITFELGIDAKGKRLRKYATVSSEKDAKKLLTEFEYNQQRNLIVNSNKMTIKEFMEHWMDNYVSYNCEETTAYGYRNIINHIVDQLAAIPLDKLQSLHIQQYYKHLMDEKGLSPNTVHKHHAILHKALDYALKQQFVYRNVAEATTLPRKIRYEGKSYTVEQLRYLLDLVKDTKLELPIYLAGLLGLRREEIVGLKWKYVDMENRLLTIQEVRTSAGKLIIVKAPKTDKSKRSLFIEDELYEVLQKQLNRQKQWKESLGNCYNDTDYVYTKPDGLPYRVNSVTEQFSSFLEKNKLPKIRLHDLRHTWCSILHNEGLPLETISKAMGHSEIGTTSRVYLHSFDKVNKSAATAMSNAIKVNDTN